MGIVAVPPLAEALAAIPDCRAARGKRHALLPILLLACVATLRGYRSQAAMAAWGRERGADWLRRLGFARGIGPRQPTPHRVFKGIAHTAVEAALHGWAGQAMRLCPPPERGALEGVAVDGKTLRGSKKRGATDAHLLAALRHRRGVVLGQVAVGDKTNEIGAADALLLTLVLEGRVVTADALLAQRGFARAVLAGGGEYRFVVKGNQPGLREDSELLFGDPALAEAAASAETVSQHGGRVEHRRLAAAAALVGYRGTRLRVVARPAAGAATRTAGRREGHRGGAAPGDRLRGHFARPRRGEPRATPRPLARPLVDRESAALGPRCRLRRGPRPGPCRPYPAGHGHQALRRPTRPRTRRPRLTRRL